MKIDRKSITQALSLQVTDGSTDDFTRTFYTGFVLCVGVYGMMNIYTFAVLILFSPVHSNVDDMDELSKNAHI